VGDEKRSQARLCQTKIYQVQLNLTMGLQKCELNVPTGIQKQVAQRISHIKKTFPK
jgi:hypothetical protein